MFFLIFQAFVKHDFSKFSSWPLELLEFASRSIEFTRSLNKFICYPKQIHFYLNEHLKFNSSANCIDFVSNSGEHEWKQLDREQFFLKMNPKKIYEIKNMAILIDLICLSSGIRSKNQEKLEIESKSNYLHSYYETFQTAKMTNFDVLSNKSFKLNCK